MITPVQQNLLAHLSDLQTQFGNESAIMSAMQQVEQLSLSTRIGWFDRYLRGISPRTPGMKDLDAIEIVATCKANLGWRSMPNLAEGIANGRDVPPLSLAKDEAAEVKIDNAKTLESAAKSWSGRGYFLCAGGYYYLAADEIRRVRTIFAYGQPRTLQSLDTLSDLILMEGAYLFASAENFCNEREQGVGRHLARIHLSEVGGDAYSELYRRLEGMDDFERRENKRLGDRTRFTIKARDEAHFAYSYCIQALRRKCIVDEIREADIKAKMLLTT